MRSSCRKPESSKMPSVYCRSRCTPSLNLEEQRRTCLEGPQMLGMSRVFIVWQVPASVGSVWRLRLCHSAMQRCLRQGPATLKELASSSIIQTANGSCCSFLHHAALLGQDLCLQVAAFPGPKCFAKPMPHLTSWVRPPSHRDSSCNTY
jgi:hypothetical protein